MKSKSTQRTKPLQRHTKKKLNPEALFRQAVNKFQLREYKNARQGFMRLVKHFPDLAESYYFLSLIATQQSDYTLAEKQIKQALKRNQTHPGFNCQYGNLMRIQGNYESAEMHYHKALENDYGHLEALINLGVTLRKLQKTDRAIEVYQQALAIRNDIPETYNNLGSCWLDRKNYQEAIECFQKAVSLNRNFAGAHHNLGIACSVIGELDKSLHAFRTAVQLEPENPGFLRDLAACFGQSKLDFSDDLIEQELIRCLMLDRVDGGTLSISAGHYIASQSSLRHLVKQDLSSSLNEFSDEDIQILSDELVLVYLMREKNCNAELELLFENFRHWLLMNCVENKVNRQNSRLMQLICALSIQCFNNEYVFFISKTESGLLTALENRIDEQLQQGGSDWLNIMVYSCYAPLYQHPSLVEYLNKTVDIPDTFAQVVERQITEPGIELSLRADIKSFTEVRDEVSKLVQTQYEENPYPRWLQMDATVSAGLKQYISSVLPGTENLLKSDPAGPDILVAGCGTGLQPVRNARRIPAAKITAIDLSRASLAYAMRMTNKLGIRNIEYMQGDILEVHRLGKQFDFIESYGVLHHMQDPLSGLRSLAGLLKQHGYMRLGLYSYHARAAIRAAREHIARKSYRPESGDIRACRRDILQLEPDDPLYTLRFSPDFYSISECRDLIFHSHEHQLDIRFIKNALAVLDLKFLGFEFPDSVTFNKFRKKYSDGDAERNLDLWERFEMENPDTFVSQYVFWVISE